MQNPNFSYIKVYHHDRIDTVGFLITHHYYLPAWKQKPIWFKKIIHYVPAEVLTSPASPRYERAHGTQSWSTRWKQKSARVSGRPSSFPETSPQCSLPGTSATVVVLWLCEVHTKGKTKRIRTASPHIKTPLNCQQPSTDKLLVKSLKNHFLFKTF